jgi:hypothetical protein
MPSSTTRHLIAVTAASLLLAACAQEPTAPVQNTSASGVQSAAFARAAAPTSTTGSEALAAVNARLAAEGANFAVDRAELSLAPTASIDRAQVIYAFDRTLRLDSRWVPGDPRRDADGNNITFMDDRSFMQANGAGDAEPSIDASLATWEQEGCSNLTLVKRPDNGLLNSVIFAGNGDPFAADILTLGFLPGAYFDLVLGAGASQSVLGVTFTYIFGSYDSEGNFTPSDINNDNRTDTALKEVWYNNAFTWTTSNTTDVDIQTVALHENGHALELGHFGKVSVNTSAGKLQVSPRAVMNAFILGVLRTPLGTDDAGYCGNFSSWPS